MQSNELLRLFVISRFLEFKKIQMNDLPRSDLANLFLTKESREVLAIWTLTGQG